LEEEGFDDGVGGGEEVEEVEEDPTSTLLNQCGTLSRRYP